MPQKDRDRVLDRFRGGDVQVLVATDVAGRGLDVSGIKLVVNFDPPESGMEYVHRCGRTGRGGDFGTAVTLLSHTDKVAAKMVARMFKRADLPVPLEVDRLLSGAEQLRKSNVDWLKNSGDDQTNDEDEKPPEKPFFDARMANAAYNHKI
jgi:superfamily II DNA/RNA helicase